MTDKTTNRFSCATCGHTCDAKDLAKGVLTVNGRKVNKLALCPKCFDVDCSLELLCDEPGCDERQTCGTPTKDQGYRMTCGKHVPKDKP